MKWKYKSGKQMHGMNAVELLKKMKSKENNVKQQSLHKNVFI